MSEPKLRKFKDKYGSEMSFDNCLSEEQIKERLNWCGKDWEEVKE